MRKEAEGPVVWIVSGEQWTRALLRAELIERGYDAVGHARLGHALSPAVLALRRPQALVLDLHGQEISPAEQARLLELRIPIIALIPAGARAELARPALRDIPFAAVLRRPLTIAGIAEAVEQTLPPT